MARPEVLCTFSQSGPWRPASGARLARTLGVFMLFLSILLSSLVAVITGGAIGIIFGFSLASQQDVLSGYRPNTTNRFLLFVCRPTSEFSAFESILFFFLIIGWLGLFVLLCAAPAIVAVRLDGEGTPAMTLSLLVFFVASYLARNIGKNLWLRLI